MSFLKKTKDALAKALKSLRELPARANRFVNQRPSAAVAWSCAIMLTVSMSVWGAYMLLKPAELSLSGLLQKVDAHQVELAEIVSDANYYSVTITSQGEEFSTKVPYGAVREGDAKDGSNIIQLLQKAGIETILSDGFKDKAATIFTFLMPALLVSGLLLIAISMAHDSSTAWMNFAKDVKTRFDDVAGAEEAKAELVEVMQMLNDAKKKGKTLDGKSASRVPRGVLLSGPPGTGKTLLAKAFAGEAGTSFISVSGSDFQSMWYGGSQRRVRALFKHARNNLPCVIFIDEFDAVGRKRAESSDIISKESNSTLNQLLVEMDGFKSNKNILVIAATNLADHLDPAVMRPGRMDRKIEVGLPSRDGRVEILKVHTKEHKLAEDVVLDDIAGGTPGFSGADLENLVNEASIYSNRRSGEDVNSEDFERALNKIIMGLERKSLVLSDEEKTLTAGHEAGHAVVACRCPDSDPVHRATIVPHGGALGMVVRLPERDRFSMPIAKLLDDLAVAMAGRAAEEILFGKERITTGAQSDIEYATKMATRMVQDWGFSPKIGMVKVSPERALHDPEVSAEVRRIVAEAYARALEILNANRPSLDALTAELLERNTIEGDDVRRIVDQHKAA